MAIASISCPSCFFRFDSVLHVFSVSLAFMYLVKQAAILELYRVIGSLSSCYTQADEYIFMKKPKLITKQQQKYLNNIQLLENNITYLKIHC